MTALRLRLLGATLALVLGTGCITIGSFQTAHTVGAGNTQIALEPSMWGVGAAQGGLLLPHVAVAARYGLNDNVDLGFRVGGNGGDILTKFVLSGGKPGETTIALAPSAGGFFLSAGTAGAGLGMVQIPLLIGIPLGDHELVLSPKLHDIFIAGGGGGSTGGGQFLSVGAGIGVALRLAPTFQVLPELTVLKPLYASAGATGEGSTGGSILNAQGVLVQLGVGILFGGR